MTRQPGNSVLAVQIEIISKALEAHQNDVRANMRTINEKLDASTAALNQIIGERKGLHAFAGAALAAIGAAVGFLGHGFLNKP